MSYYSPIYIEQNVKNGFLMGLVLSVSSLIGVISDFLLSRVSKERGFRIFFISAIIGAVLFPLSLLLFPPWVPILLFAMIVWGVYYELIGFSNFVFIKGNIPREKYPTAWGITETLKSSAYFVGPILAVFLIDRGPKVPFISSLGFYFFCFVAFALLFSLKIKRHSGAIIVKEEQISIRHTLNIWKILMQRVYPLYMFLFTITVIDATFWSVGAVFSETFKNTSFLGRFIIPIYMLPSLGLSIFAGSAAKPFGKKRVAFLCGIGTGLGLLAAGFVHNIYLVLIAIFFSSMFSAIAIPEVAASFEDYVSRLGKFGPHMIGLQSSAISSAYVVGPIVAGAFSSIVGNQETFAVVGGMMLVVSIVALIITPRKLKMPQAEIGSEIVPTQPLP